MRRNIIDIIVLETSFLILSLSSAFAKAAATCQLYNFEFARYVALSIGLLAVYALLWQQILKRFTLTVAFSNRVIYYFWILLWSVLFFKETVTAFNILGLALICFGIIKVAQND